MPLPVNASGAAAEQEEDDRHVGQRRQPEDATASTRLRTRRNGTRNVFGVSSDQHAGPAAPQAAQPHRHRRPRTRRRPRHAARRRAWATTTGASRRSASRRRGTRSRPATCRCDRLAKKAKDGVRGADGFPLEFGTISVSDGISMGHSGMHYSLVSREVIADSVETVFRAEQLDGGVLLAGCDKSLPGMLMAAARLDVAAVFLYAGSTLPGQARRPRRHDHRRVRGRRRLPGRAHQPRRGRPRSRRRSARARAPAAACTPPTRWPARPRRWACRCPAAPPRPRPTRAATPTPSAPARPPSHLVDAGITARTILTKEAFENAITVVMALGGSTNAVLHLLAIAHEAQVELDPRRLQPHRRQGAAPGRRQAVRRSTS